jgi:quercetin dioxygenase-like cupin family protein
MGKEKEKELQRLGMLLKDLRKKKTFTLSMLSERAQCSIGYLSQVERGMISPTISTFKKIATALDVDLMYFFNEESSSTSYVVRKNKRKKVVYELLKPAGKTGTLEPLLIRFKPGAKSETKAFTHQGEECLYVLKGKLNFYLNNETYLLNEGDSIWYPAFIGHGWENVLNKTALVIRVTTPPSF